MASSLQIVQQFYPKVKRVVDAKRDLSVSLTKRDVTTAKRKDHNGCAMVEACRRMPEVEGVIVSTRTAYLVKGEVATRFLVPERVTREITSFDRGADFAVGDYRLKKPYRRYEQPPRKRTKGERPKSGPSLADMSHRDIKHAIEGVRTPLPNTLPKGKRIKHG